MIPPHRYSVKIILNFRYPCFFYTETCFFFFFLLQKLIRPLFCRTKFDTRRTFWHRVLFLYGRKSRLLFRSENSRVYSSHFSSRYFLTVRCKVAFLAKTKQRKNRLRPYTRCENRPSGAPFFLFFLYSRPFYNAGIKQLIKHDLIWIIYKICGAKSAARRTR